MAHGVEVRLPFLDHEFFELTRMIPAPLLAQGGVRKHLLREAARPFITDEVYRGEKQPFFAPPATLGLDNPMYQMIQDELRSRTLSLMPFFDLAAVGALLDRVPSMDQRRRASLDPILFMMASLCILQRSYRL